MLLCDDDIQKCLKDRELKIEPFLKENLGPDSIDIRLSGELLVAKKVGKVIDPFKTDSSKFFEKKTIPKQGFVLSAGDFVLGSTIERVGLSDLISAQIEGRSSLGRLGIMVHMTAGIIHAGFGSKSPSSLTLEIGSVNPNPVKLYEGMKIAQLSFFRLSKKASCGYDYKAGSKYVQQEKPLAPRTWMDKK